MRYRDLPIGGKRPGKRLRRPERFDEPRGTAYNAQGRVSPESHEQEVLARDRRDGAILRLPGAMPRARAEPPEDDKARPPAEKPGRPSHEQPGSGARPGNRKSSARLHSGEEFPRGSFPVRGRSVDRFYVR